MVGGWEATPIGPMTDVMWARPDGHRVLLAPSDAAAAFITAVYRFDEVRVVPVTGATGPRRVAVAAGSLRIELRAGPGLRLPFGSRRPAWWHRTVEGPVARALLGVRVYGTSPTGVHEWYRTDAWRPVRSGSARVDGADLGPLAPVWPPVGFGFSEPPRRPSLAAVRPLLEDPSGVLDVVLRAARRS